VIGPKVSVASSGMVTTTVSCPAAALAGCAGDVLVLTQRSYAPRVGGPSGPLRVLFAYVTVAAGKSVTINRAIPADIAAFLRRARSVRVRVTATLNANSRSTATRTLTFSR
jgi:hypothetical protein